MAATWTTIVPVSRQAFVSFQDNVEKPCHKELNVEIVIISTERVTNYTCERAENEESNEYVTSEVVNNVISH